MVKKNKARISTDMVGYFLLGILVFIIVIPVGPKIASAAGNLLDIFLDKNNNDENKEFEFQPSFYSFTNLYKVCKDTKASGCICPEFDISLIPKGYDIHLEQLKTQTRIFFSKDNQDTEEPGQFEIIDNDKLCYYRYDHQKNELISDHSQSEFIIPSDRKIVIRNKVLLYKASNIQTCIVGGGQEKTDTYENIKQSTQSCFVKAEKPDKVITGLIEHSNYLMDYNEKQEVMKHNTLEGRNIYEYLEDDLESVIGPVVKSPKKPGDGVNPNIYREEMLDLLAYEKFDYNRDRFISDNVYFISLRTLEADKDKFQGEKKDYIEIHILKDAPYAELLAQAIKKEFEQLNGKEVFEKGHKIYTEAKELPEALISEENRFEINVKVTPHDILDNDPVFIKCTQKPYIDYYICKENRLLPAVFIDIVEVYESTDDNKLFPYHEQTISKAIMKGVNNFYNINLDIDTTTYNGEEYQAEHEMKYFEDQLESFEKKASLIDPNTLTDEMKDKSVFCRLTVFDPIFISEDNEIIIEKINAENQYQIYYKNSEDKSVGSHNINPYQVYEKFYESHKIFYPDKIVIQYDDGKQNFIIFNPNPVFGSQATQGKQLSFIHNNGKYYFALDDTSQDLFPPCEGTDNNQDPMIDETAQAEKELKIFKNDLDLLEQKGETTNSEIMENKDIYCKLGYFHNIVVSPGYYILINTKDDKSTKIYYFKQDQVAPIITQEVPAYKISNKHLDTRFDDYSKIKITSEYITISRDESDIFYDYRFSNRNNQLVLLHNDGLYYWDVDTKSSIGNKYPDCESVP